MPQLDFPSSPAPGDVHGAWRWDGAKWNRQAHNLSPAGTRIGNFADWSDWPIPPPR